MPALGVPLLLIGLAGCAVQTQPRPSVAPPSGWRTELEGIATAESQWWRAFDDPKLSALIEDAQLQNLDVAAAAQRVAQAQATLSIARGQQFPAADLGATVQKISGTTSSSVSIGATYALDLWSEARARAFGARSQLEAAEAGHVVTLWRLASAVAQLYYQRRALDERLALAREGLELAERTFSLVQTRYDAGAISGLDVAQARTTVEAERSNVASVLLARDLAHNAMAVLLGRAPAELTDFELSSESLLNLAPPSLPQESPSEVLARRPDIRVLEAQLRAADAIIAVARAQLFPQITIGADGTRVRGVEEVIFTSGANLIWAVFDGGQRRAGVRLAEAQYGELLENYRAGILDALTEIEDALTQVRHLSVRETSDREVVASAGRAYQLSRIQYESGLVDALTLLVVQNTYLRARDALIQTRLSYLQSAVALYSGMSP